MKTRSFFASILFLIFALLACNFASQFETQPEIGPPPTIVGGVAEQGGGENGTTAVSGTPIPIDPNQQPTVAPTATLPAPRLTLSTLDAVNVRQGPSTRYDVIEQFPAGRQATIVGQSMDGKWWAIEHPGGVNGRGWVFGELVSLNSSVGSVNGLPALPDPPILETEREEYQNDAQRYALEYSKSLLDLPNFGAPDSEQYFATVNARSPQELPLGGFWLTISVHPNPDERPLTDWSERFDTPDNVRSLTVDGNPAIQQTEDNRPKPGDATPESSVGIVDLPYSVVTYIAHEDRVVEVRAITPPALPTDDPFVYYRAEYDAILASLKLKPENAGPLDFDVNIVWRIDPNNKDEAIATVTITARGGDGDYVYYRDGSLRQDGSVFEYRWRACRGNPVSFQVEDGTGARVSKDMFEQVPCGD